MTGWQVLRLAPVLGPMFLVAACASPSDLQGSNHEVARRMQARLAPDIATGQATVQYGPDSTSVTFTDQSLFARGGAELDDNRRLILARFVQGLLAPSITRIDVADPPAAPGTLQAARIQAVRQYFLHYGLGPTLQSPGGPAATAGAVPPGLTITVRVVWS